MLLIPYFLICALVFWLFRRRPRKRLTGYILAVAAISTGLPVFWITFGALGIPLFGVLAAGAIFYEPRGKRRQGWGDPGEIPGGAVQLGRGARLLRNRQ